MGKRIGYYQTPDSCLFMYLYICINTVLYTCQENTAAAKVKPKLSNNVDCLASKVTEAQSSARTIPELLKIAKKELWWSSVRFCLLPWSFYLASEGGTSSRSIRGQPNVILPKLAWLIICMHHNLAASYPGNLNHNVFDIIIAWIYSMNNNFPSFRPAISSTRI